MRALELISKSVSIALISLVFLILFDVFNRYLFSNGSIALQELEWHIFDGVMLLSLFYTLRHNGHVRVDIIYGNLAKKYRDYIDLLSHIFFIIPFALLIIYTSYSFVEMSYLQNEISSDPGGLQYRFIVKSLILVGFSLLIVQSIYQIKEILQKLTSSNN